MSHPYYNHKQNTVGKRRVKVLMKSGDVPMGGTKHKDEAQDRALISQMMADEQSPGGDVAKGRMDRFARGGRVKPSVNINIISPPGHGSSPAGPAPVLGPPGGLPPPGGPPLPPPMPPPGPPMMGGSPPGLPPGGPPLMRKDGGRAEYRSGISTPGNIKKWTDYASSNSYAKGGYVGGADTGVGRLEKKNKYGLTPHGSK